MGETRAAVTCGYLLALWLVRGGGIGIVNDSYPADGVSRPIPSGGYVVSACAAMDLGSLPPGGREGCRRRRARVGAAAALCALLSSACCTVGVPGTAGVSGLRNVLGPRVRWAGSGHRIAGMWRVRPPRWAPTVGVVADGRGRSRARCWCRVGGQRHAGSDRSARCGEWSAMRSERLLCRCTGGGPWVRSLLPVD